MTTNQSTIKKRQMDHKSLNTMHSEESYMCRCKPPRRAKKEQVQDKSKVEDINYGRTLFRCDLYGKDGGCSFIKWSTAPWPPPSPNPKALDKSNINTTKSVNVIGQGQKPSSLSSPPTPSMMMTSTSKPKIEFDEEDDSIYLNIDVDNLVKDRNRLPGQPSPTSVSTSSSSGGGNNSNNTNTQSSKTNKNGGGMEMYLKQKKSPTLTGGMEGSNNSNTGGNSNNTKSNNKSKSGSNNNNGSTGNNTINTDILDVKCYCRQTATTRISQKDNQRKGQRYYTCDNCKFFEWQDRILLSRNPKFPSLNTQIAYSDKILKGSNRDRFSLEVRSSPIQKGDDEGDNQQRQHSPESNKWIDSDYCNEMLAQMMEREGFGVQIYSEYEEFFLYKSLRITKGKYDEEMDWKIYVQPAGKIDPCDLDVQYEKIWVQIEGIRPKEKGWLQGSESDIIAFECSDYFLFVDRKVLWQYVDTFVQKRYVSDVKEADHCLFKMPNSPFHSPYEVKTLLSIESMKSFNIDKEKNPSGLKLVVDVFTFPKDLAGPFRVAIDGYRKMNVHPPILLDRAREVNAISTTASLPTNMELS